MNKEQFIEAFKDILQRDEDLTLDMPLENIDEWDSIVKMEIIAYFDEKFGLKLNYSDFKDVKSVEDIANKICS